MQFPREFSRLASPHEPIFQIYFEIITCRSSFLNTAAGCSDSLELANFLPHQ